MAKNTYKSNTFKTEPKAKGKKKASRKPSLKVNLPFLKDRRFQLSVGFFLLLSAVFIFLACTSYLFTGKADQSVVEAFFDKDETVRSLGREASNWMKLLGALVAHKLIFSWFGISAFLIPPYLFLLGYIVVWGKALMKLSRALVFTLFFLVWISMLMGSMIKSGEGISEWSFYSGGLGYELSMFFDDLLGFGTILFLIFTLLVFVIFYFNITEVFSTKKAATTEGEVIPSVGNEDVAPVVADSTETPKVEPAGEKAEETSEVSRTADEEELKNWIVSLKENQPEEKKVEEKPTAAVELKVEAETPAASEPKSIKEVIDETSIAESLELEVNAPEPPKPAPKDKNPKFEVELKEASEKLVEKAGHYDPTLDLGSYKFLVLIYSWSIQQAKSL